MASRTCEEVYGKHLTIICLPREILEKIFSYLTYDETSAVRMVSKMFDLLCRQRLNDGLNRVDRLHSQIHRELKGKLPRRESERRNHVLARHIDILSAIETRLSLLNMTYSKYIDMGLCCFIPGKVLDEMFHVLNEIRIVSNPPRAHELLQELRDISSMAMEHFDEKIVPLLKQETQAACSRFSYSDAIASLTSVPRLHKSRLQKSNTVLLRLEKKFVGHRKLLLKQNRRVRDLEKKLVEQINITTELERHKTEQDRRIAELEQKIVDYDQRFVDMMVEIARVRGSCGGGDTSVAQSTKDGKSLVEVGCDVKIGSIECASEGVGTDEVKPGGRVVAKRARRKPRVAAQLANNSGDHNVTVLRSHELGTDAVHDDATAANDAATQQKTVVAKAMSSKDVSSLVAQADIHPIATKQRKRKIAETCANTSVPVHQKRNRKVE